MDAAPAEGRLTTRLAALGFVALALIWGTQFLIIRVGQRDLPPLLTVALRYVVLAAVAHILTLRFDLHAPPGSGAARLGFGALQAVSMGLLYWAEGHVASAIAAAVIMTEPLFVALIAPVLLQGERLTARVVLALVCGSAGVLLLLARQPLEGGTRGLLKLATVAVVLSALVGAFARVLGKELIARVPPLVMLRDTGWIVAALSFAGWAALEHHRPLAFTAGAVVAFAYLGLIGSVAASWLYLVLLRRYRVTSMAYLQFVTPLVAIATGVLLGRERLGLLGAAGAAIILVGLVVLAAPARQVGGPSRPAA